VIARRPINLNDVGVPLDEDNLLGLRMTAAEYLALPECDVRYELMDGVIIAPPETWGPLPEDADNFGLRMTAKQFRELPESPLHYELIDGVVIVSPSPTFWHQKVVFEIQRQIDDYLQVHPIGEVIADIDITVNDDVAYRPDILFLTREKSAKVRDRIESIPDLVVEVVSPGSRGVDSRTKFRDYEAAGIREYWLIDPQMGRMQFFVLDGRQYREAVFGADEYASTTLPGFKLDLERVRRLF
jgi:Uma2 family endonuclease